MSQSAGYIAAILTILCWTFGTFVFTKASRLVAPATVNRVRLLLALIWLTIITCLYEKIFPIQLFTLLNQQQIFWFGLSGIVGLTIGDHYSFTAFKILGSRRATLFNCFAPASALIAGIFLLDETLSAVGIFGMIISASGVLMLSLSQHEKNQVINEGHGHYAEGIFAGFMSAIGQGVGLALARQGFLTESDFVAPAIHATWMRMLAASVCIYAFGAFKTNVVKEFVDTVKNKEYFSPIFLGSILGPTMGVSFSLYATSILEVSVAQTILSLVPVVVMLVSVIFFKEKIKLFSYLAALVSIIGVLILVWRNGF